MCFEERSFGCLYYANSLIVDEVGFQRLMKIIKDVNISGVPPVGCVI